MPKILVALLISSKFNIVKHTFDTLINQLRFTDYGIIIFVNTLDELFYNEVVDFFKHHNYSRLKRLIRTESNGKPGKGYNSLFSYFKNDSSYEYLFTMDGDDFLYPESLYRVNMLIDKYNPDIINLAGNTKFVCKNTLNKERDTSYTFSCNYLFNESRVVKFSEGYNTALATPSRAVIVSRKVAQYYDTLHHDDMYTFSDYKIFLISYKEYNAIESRLKIIFVSDPYMYVWNGANEGSTSGGANVTAYKDLFDKQEIQKIKKNLNITELRIDKIPIILHTPEIDQGVINDFYLKIISESFEFNPKKSLFKIKSQ